MTISLADFLADLTSNPALALTAALTLGVVLVNGWTDAPNAIATCVSTKAITPRAAILMAAVFNFLGVFVMTLLNASVAATIYNMVDTWFVARLGTQAVAACGVTLSIMELMMSIGYWLGTGGALLIGMLLGAQKKEEANQIGSTAFFSTLAIGSVLAALGIIFITPLMRFLGSSETILP